tara:strand:- start:455 stop:3250 length:2796 start_codon:yes stop_codon:yes gene_type:complete
MGIISRAIPTLLRGVSQAADSTKQSDHADIQDNANSSPVQGLTKRSGSQYVATLSASELTNVHVHTINRDTSERYQVVLGDESISVYKLDGTAYTISNGKVIAPDGVSYLNIANTNTPAATFRTVTIADYTFIVNKTKQVKMDSATSAGLTDVLNSNTVNIKGSAIVFINQVSASTDYTVTVNSTTATYNSGTTNLSTTLIAAKIKDKLLGNNGESPTSGSALSGNTSNGFVINQNGPVLYIRKYDGLEFTIDANDSQGNSQTTLIKDSVQTFTDLPTVAPNNYVVEIKGDETTNFDNYFVKFVTNNGGIFEEGQWEETLKPDILYKIDSSTMPHVLIRQADNNFRFTKADGSNYGCSGENFNKAATYTTTGSDNTVTITRTDHGFLTGDLVNVVRVGSGNLVSGQFIVERVDANTLKYITANNEGTDTNASCTIGPGFSVPTWKDRTVGDETTAPNPSFVNSTINNVIFFRNRLGFLCDDNVVLSRVSEFFNFFPETVTTVIDSDPIDVAASHTKVSILEYAITMGEQLILFSDQTQFVLSSSSETLTPKTANIIVATEFESSTAAAPVGSGRSIYYLTKKGSFAGVREYITQEDVAIKDAADITIHIPRYIPSGIFKLEVSTSEDVLVLLGSDNQNKLYINRWLYGENFNKVLNSWSSFTFNSARKILGASFIDTDLYLVIATSSGTFLEKLPFESNYKEPNTEFEYHLDHKVTEATTGVSVTFDPSSNTTTWLIPYKTYAAMSVVGRHLASNETSTFISSPNESATALVPGQVIATTTTNTNGSTATITATGDYRASKIIIGEPYEMHYRFSQQRLTDTASTKTTGSEIVSGRLQMHHYYIKYEDTGFFKVEVTPDNRATSTHEFSGQLLGAASSTIGQVNLETGTFRVPIMSRADRVNVDVKNNSFLPTQLSSAEYEARFHMRSRRI